MTNQWQYQGQIWQPPEDFSSDIYYGFVYCITNKTNNMKYIGKKFFWSSKTLPITKTRKRKKKTLVESDWRTYYGSNKALKEIISEDDKNLDDVFHREILRLCKTKGECAYFETKEQFDKNALIDDQYYNGIISCRINKNSVKHLTKEYLNTNQLS